MTNPIEIYEKLKSAMPEAQASAVVQAIRMAFGDYDSRHSKALANKVDGIKFDAGVHQMETSFNHSMAALESKVDGRFQAFEAKMDSRFGALEIKMKGGFEAADLRLVAESARLETKIAESKASMIRWMFLFWIGQIAAMKFLR